MPRASSSQGSQSNWCFPTLALKNPPIWNFPLRLIYSVDPTAAGELDASDTRNNSSLGLGSVMVLGHFNAACADLKLDVKLSVHSILSLDSLPATEVSSWDKYEE